MENTTDLISEAREFAIKTHGNQMYGNRPYIHHLEECLRIFGGVIDQRDLLSARKHLIDEIGAAIFLHDTMEDQAVHYAILEDRFGKNVAEAVWCVTKIKPYNPALYFEKISQNPIAAIVKLCDRICNVNNCFDIQGNIIPEHRSKLDKYIQEDKYILNILDFDSITSLSDKTYYQFIISGLHTKFHKGYMEKMGIYRAKGDEDKPANDEFIIQIKTNKDSTNIYVLEPVENMDPTFVSSIIAALEKIKYKILQHHGIK